MATTQDYLTLSENVYNSGAGNPDGWTRFDESHQDSGYDGEAYRNNTTGEIVVVHRGTEGDDPRDKRADWDIANGRQPTQFEDGREFYREVRQQYPDAVITQRQAIR